MWRELKGRVESHETWTGHERDSVFFCELKKVDSELSCPDSFFFSSFVASSTPAVNIQPDVSGGWDWHTKPGKDQQMNFVPHNWSLKHNPSPKVK